MATPDHPDQGPPSVAGYESIIGWDPATLQGVERELARSMGPVARVLVKRAARSHSTLDQLARAIAPSIMDEAARQAFVAKYDGRGPESRPAGSVVPPPPIAAGPASVGSEGPPLTSVDIEDVTRILTVEMGPIARVVVKRAAMLSRTRRALCARVAEAIDDAGARERFLKATAK